MEKLKEEFKEALIEIWKDNIVKDYKDFYLWRESTFKCRLYMHIINKLGDDFFKKNNLRLFTDFHLKAPDSFPDMVLVDVSDRYNLNILSIIELKNKYLTNRTEKKIEEDYQKMKTYNETYPEVDLFMATVNGNVDPDYVGTSWIQTSKNISKNYDWKNQKLIELIFDDAPLSDEKISSIFDWKNMKQLD